MRELSAEMLKSIAARFEVESVLSELSKLEAMRPEVRIGFLGEFSTGKTSLVNALLGNTYLPESVEPTNGAITVVDVSREVQEVCFFKYSDDGEEIEIDALELDDLVRGRGDATPLLKVPETEILKEGFQLIDTPGLVSLNETHSEVTLGYLPMLDTAVVCIDVNSGGIRQSVINFLNREDVKISRKSFVFAITKCDTKSEEASRRIAEDVLGVLKEVYSDEEWNFVPEKYRVILTSAREALGSSSFQTGIERLKEALLRVFVAREGTFVKERKKMMLVGVARRLIEALEDKIENFTLAEDDLRSKEDELDAEVARLKRAIEKEKKRFNNMIEDLRSDCGALVQSHADKFSSEMNQEEAEEIVNGLSKEVFTRVESLVNHYFKGLELPPLPLLDGSSVWESVNGVIKAKNIGTMVATAVVTSVVLPGAGVAGNAVEAAGGAAAETLAGTAATQRVKTAGKLGKFMKGVGEVIKHINPVDMVGGLIASPLVKNRALETLSRELDELLNKIERRLYNQIDEAIFQPILDSLEEKREELKRAREERRKKESFNVKRLTEARDTLKELKSFVQ